MIISEVIADQKGADERFRQVFEGAPNAMVMSGREGRITMVNAEAERLFGYSRAELLGSALELLVPLHACASHPSLRAGYMSAPVSRAMGLGRDLHGLRKDGSEVPIEIRLNPIETAEGTFVIASIVDITERVRLERELRDANAELERRVEHRTRELDYKAQQLERASRVKSEFLANVSHELRTPLSAVLVLSELLAENLEQNLSERQIQYAQTVNAAGRDLLSLIDDILDLAKVEAGMVELDVAPLELAGLGIEVDQKFRPLCEQKGLSLEIAIDVARTQMIETDSKRLRQIVKNLLSNAIKFTESGTVRLEIAPASSGWPMGHGILDRARRVVAVAVQDDGIGIAEGQQSLIFDAFRQADASNSRHYGGTGLGLAISRELATLLGGALTVKSALGAGSLFTLWLPDRYRGPHLSMAKVGSPSPAPPAPAAEPQQFSSTPDAAIAEGAPLVGDARESVHGGERPLPDVENRGAKGPDQMLSLTAGVLQQRGDDGAMAQLQGGEATFGRDVSAGLAGKTILLVNDDPRTVFALTGLMEQQGMKVITAVGGREALDQLEAHPQIALVLMDIMMPGMDGYQAIRAIRGDDRHANLPLIALTAKAMKGDKETCLAAGANDYLSKPVDSVRLLRMLRIWLPEKD